MLTILQSILLGIIQGVTEWLPISSSGHLVLIQELLNLEVPVAFDVWLHLATLLVIFLFFQKDIIKILNALFTWKIRTYEFRLAIFLSIASIATAIMVLAFKNFFEKAFSNLLAVGIAFMATGLLLSISEKNLKNKKITSKPAAVIGVAQGLAFMPGISRSGSTISAALLLSIKKQDAFKFSFLLAIPAIIATSILKTNELAASNIPLTSLAAGFMAAVIVGFLSLTFLKKIVMQGKFHYFAYYCWFIGILTLISHFLL